MDAAILRILDANFNRAREGLRVMEEHARMVLNDARLSTEIKQLRHDLAAVGQSVDMASLLSSRDTPGDVGTTISTPSESVRGGAEAVAAAACKRVAESLRCIEEYGKTLRLAAAAVDPPGTASIATRVEAIRYRVYTAEQSLLVTVPRRRKLADARLHVLLTESLCRRPWRDVAAAVLEAGAGAIQLREKGMPDAVLLERARELREMTRTRDALLIINDRPDIARLCGADGADWCDRSRRGGDSRGDGRRGGLPRRGADVHLADKAECLRERPGTPGPSFSNRRIVWRFGAPAGRDRRHRYIQGSKVGCDLPAGSSIQPRGVRKRDWGIGPRRGSACDPAGVRT